MHFYVAHKRKLADSVWEVKEKELSRVQSELRTLVDKNESASLEIAELREKLTAGSQLVEESKVKIEETKAEMVAEMQENQRMQNELIETQLKVTELEEVVNRLRKELLNTENVFAATSKEGVIAQLSERIEELTAENSKLRDEIRVVKPVTKDTDSSSIADQTDTNRVDSTQFTVQKLTSEEVSAIEEETKIASLSVANGIIVLNADKKLNLEIGTVIKLVKDSKAIAQVKVININGSLAIASVLPGAKLDDLSKGDTVKILR